MKTEWNRRISNWTGETEFLLFKQNKGIVARMKQVKVKSLNERLGYYLPKIKFDEFRGMFVNEQG